jgi:hypothetical protein
VIRFPDGRVGGLISRVTAGEQLCREYALAAPAGIFGELAGSVGSGVITDPAQRATIEVDVAVLGVQAPGSGREYSRSARRTRSHQGLAGRAAPAQAADLLASQGYDTSDTVLVCYGGSGFESGLDGAMLIGPAQLYAESGPGIAPAAGDER